MAEPAFPLAQCRNDAPEPIAVRLEGVSKSFDGTPVLHEIDLDVARGEFVAIVGFSGSGKTTLVNLIAGLERPDAGAILVNDQFVEDAGPDRGIVFQSYALLPWLSVLGNVQLAVDQVLADAPIKTRRERAMRCIDLVNLTAASDKRPHELSGGMRQRVAVARALATDPEILLMDEPLSALDALTRGKLQEEILDIWDQDRKTMVLITNDVDEALLMADRVIPLTPGPEATLGPVFEVDIARPRVRKAMNHDRDFTDLRREITSYLLTVGAQVKETTKSKLVALPNATPNTRRDEVVALQQSRERSVTTKQLERYVEFHDIKKTYPVPGSGQVDVVNGFDLRIRKGEFVGLIGHSGCGKSTVLSMLAGLNETSAGSIVLDATEVTTAGPDRGIVFQAPSLMPWLTARDNVALGVETVYPHIRKSERRDIVEHYLQRVGLANAMDKKAADLSNGMRQRVGIARAFALSPKMLLLDEPFGMLDSLTRWDLQEVLMEVWERTKVTTLMVTHDIDEAILLADRVVMMTNGPNAKVGKIQPIDLPRPRTRKSVMAHPDYYDYRDSLLTFLNECEHTT